MSQPLAHAGWMHGHLDRWWARWGWFPNRCAVTGEPHGFSLCSNCKHQWVQEENQRVREDSFLCGHSITTMPCHLPLLGGLQRCPPKGLFLRWCACHAISSTWVNEIVQKCLFKNNINMHFLYLWALRFPDFESLKGMFLSGQPVYLIC